MAAKGASGPSAPTLRGEGIVLARHLAGESPLRLTVLSASHGRLMCLQRQSARSTMEKADLFDTAELVLEGPKPSGFYFVTAYALHTRRVGIGRSYAALKHASEFAEILAHNSQHAADIAPLIQLADTVFAAWETGHHPEAAAFKALCLLSRNEGYPLNEQFLAQLPEGERAQALQILHEPLDKQTTEQTHVEHLLALLRQWVKGYTDIWIP